MTDIYKNYLRDLGLLIREQALDAHKGACSSPDDGFKLGRRMSYYAITSLMLHQAEAFGISPNDIGLAGLDPDKDLLGSNGMDI